MVQKGESSFDKAAVGGSDVSVVVPASREEGEVGSVPPSPPEEADAGGSMESQQASNDDVSLCGCCGHQQESSSFTSHPIISLSMACSETIFQNHLKPVNDYQTDPSNLLYLEEITMGI